MRRNACRISCLPTSGAFKSHLFYKVVCLIYALGLFSAQLPIILAPGRGGREDAVKGELRIRDLSPRRQALHINPSGK